MLRLQQILFYRELGLSLDEIQKILDSPDFDVMQALQSHKDTLQKRLARLMRLIDTVDKTILQLVQTLGSGLTRRRIRCVKNHR